MAASLTHYRRMQQHQASGRRLRGGLGRLGRFGDTAGQSIDNLDGLAWTSAQKVALQNRASAVSNLPPYLHPELTLFLPPADSKPFIVTPTLFPTFPAALNTPETIISYTAPQGCIAVINKIAIVYIGGGPPDGTNTVVWSVLVNGAGVKGLSQLTSQVGTYAAPNDTEILLYEGDIAIVQVTSLAVPPVGTTAARFHGWTYPISEAILPPTDDQDA